MVYASGKSALNILRRVLPVARPAVRRAALFANLAGAAAGNGVDIAEEPGDGVKEPPGFVDAHWRNHLSAFIRRRNFYYLTMGG